MNFSFYFLGINLPLWALLAASLLIPFIITWVAIPTIVKVSSEKKLFDLPNERTSHTITTPLLGGISIFAGFVISAVVFSLPADSVMIRYIIGGIIVLFFAGLKDDILIIDPWKKFLSQVISASFVAVLGDIRITDFHSVFGIQELPYLVSIFFTIFLIITLINGFNLIDGVDGLASGIGIINSLFFGVWFLSSNHYTLSVLCFSLAGSLIAYFIFNVFGKKNKIFMGDTGSMIIGLIVAVFTIMFLECEKPPVSPIRFTAAPALAFGCLVVPLFDTLRVVILRIRNGKSPFKADRNHVHHNLLKLGFSHLQVTFISILVNIAIVIFVFLVQKLGTLRVILLIVLFVTLLSVWLDYRILKKGLSEVH